MSALIHIYFVLDRSGSMEIIADDVIGGFNAFVASQKKQEGECLMTLTQFDCVDAHEVVACAKPIDQIDRLDDETFLPRGGTPLYDAMGRVIADATIRAEQRKARGRQPENILFVTFTDGEENSSSEYDREQILALIEKRTEQGWTFAYLGANQDAFAESKKIGYAPGSVRSYQASSVGTKRVFAKLIQAASEYRKKVHVGKRDADTSFFDDVD